jgi:hypothetical protein
LKKARTVKIYQEGYIDETEFQAEIAAVTLALRKLEVPEVDGVTYDDVVEAGEHLPGMAALWDVATPEERRDMVTLILQPEGLYYDTELKMIAAMKPQPAFLPVLRMLKGVVEYEETSGLLVTEHWSNRNRRASGYLQEVRVTAKYVGSRVQINLLIFYLLIAPSSRDIVSTRKSISSSFLTPRIQGKFSLHNFCIWLNQQMERAPVTFADLLDW